MDNRERVFIYLSIIISALVKLLLCYDSDHIASHAGIFSGARTSSLPTNACSTENNIPFPSVANHIVLSKFWKVDLDGRVTQQLLNLHETMRKLYDL